MNISSSNTVTIGEIAHTLVSISKNKNTIVSFGELSCNKKFMNNDKVSSELNWKVKHSLKQSLEETFLYYQMSRNE